MGHTFSLLKKMNLIFGSLLFFTITALSIFSFFMIKNSVHQTMLETLQKESLLVKNNIELVIYSSIKSNLKGVAKQNRSIVDAYYQKFLTGTINQKQMMEQIRTLLLAQKVGDTGYIAGVSSNGILSIHPKSEGVNVSGFDFWKDIKKILATKEQSGYLEYMWKNKGESSARAKAAWIEYYAPLDLIIWISSYRSEFLSLVDKKQIENNLLKMKIGESGYFYIIDTKGELIIHPALQGKNIYESKDADGRFFIKKICEKKEGIITYPWKNPGEEVARDKIVSYDYVEQIDWIIAAGGYIDELTSSVQVISVSIMGLGIVFLLIGIAAVIFFSSRIVSPVIVLKNNIDGADLTKRISVTSNDEIGQMAHSFNTFTGKLHTMFKKIDEQVQFINKSSSEFSITARDLTDRSQRTATTAEEVAAIVEEILASNSHIFDIVREQHQHTIVLIKDINSLYNIVKDEESRMDSASEVKVHLDMVISEMRVKIRETLEQIGASFKDSRNMIAYTDTIYNISEQINMLALNASIEAARAGDSGRGFAVVAEEIGKLATEVDENTKNISSVMTQTGDGISKSNNVLEATVGLIEKTLSGLDRFDEIFKSVAELAKKDLAINEKLQADAKNFLDRADKILSSISEEKNGITEISNAVEHLNTIAQDNSASSEELHATTDQLHENAKELKREIDRFKL